ncbi:substrate-binding domain-containing protein [Noviherbaspirillum galbum]|uniref:Helix-turn-helix transcriptional regulator n=1 Tax=Noviherbaspirillum galbum TaxID=2709383 RepID=A0A6B3SUT6_9BURK|nr:substrate-binding domain-containing protein [Noviherbaspirillum galbum]NEX62132.1 helix-turn-helix transcriptional regulator [Noviherbaspirillum galbum]
MHKVTITPTWTLTDGEGRQLPYRVVELLTHVEEHGSLQEAARVMGVSYRHSWGLLHEAEQTLGASLLDMARGRHARLTPLAQRFVWADRRIKARLSPALDSLSSEMEQEVRAILSSSGRALRLHASHGFAVEQLNLFLTNAGCALDLKYRPSFDAVAALAAGGCDMAGFHLPIGRFEPAMAAHYRRWLRPERQRVIHVARRRQGLMVQRGNPKKIYAIEDLARPDVRFINRQIGSGTRLLMELMLESSGISPEQVTGHDQNELTHAAVAACVASGMADVAFGVETPARRFDLEFLPLQSERYMLLADVQLLDPADLERVVNIMSADTYRRVVSALPGYDGSEAGRLQRIEDIFGCGDGVE